MALRGRKRSGGTTKTTLREKWSHEGARADVEARGSDASEADESDASEIRDCERKRRT